MKNKIIERMLMYEKRAIENSNKVLNKVSHLLIFIVLIFFLFFRDSFLYNYVGLICLIGFLAHPYVQYKIKKIINEIILSQKMLRSKETDWMELK